jgi:uncharacterized protein YggT (Ycf19 family)
VCLNVVAAVLIVREATALDVGFDVVAGRLVVRLTDPLVLILRHLNPPLKPPVRSFAADTY